MHLGLSMYCCHCQVIWSLLSVPWVLLNSAYRLCRLYTVKYALHMVCQLATGCLQLQGLHKTLSLPLIVLSCQGYIIHYTLNWPMVVSSCQGYIKHSNGHLLSSAVMVTSNTQLATVCLWLLVVINCQGYIKHSTGQWLQSAALVT